ncbi:hypothetical protein AB9K35_15895 [Leisingera sp. XS_AS12]|uniref:hypothetical protein n=1 Tax=Leisingera sp. XS_AS12 TaxID=3241294 RepID=UPI0035149EA9
MKIKITTNCAGPFGSFTVGQTPTVADELGRDLLRAQYAELVDAKAQPPAPRSEATEATEATEAAAKPARKSKA